MSTELIVFCSGKCRVDLTELLLFYNFTAAMRLDFVVIVHVESLTKQENDEKDVDEPQKVAAQCNWCHNASSILCCDQHGQIWGGKVELALVAQLHDVDVVENEEDEEHQIDYDDDEGDENPYEEKDIDGAKVGLLDAW